MVHAAAADVWTPAPNVRGSYLRMRNLSVPDDATETSATAAVEFQIA